MKFLPSICYSLFWWSKKTFSTLVLQSAYSLFNCKLFKKVWIVLRTQTTNLKKQMLWHAQYFINSIIFFFSKEKTWKKKYYLRLLLFSHWAETFIQSNLQRLGGELRFTTSAAKSLTTGPQFDISSQDGVQGG